MKQGKLEKGKYIAELPGYNYATAALNGLAKVYPKSEMIYDGLFCRFYKEGTKVWSCNPVFANAHFKLTPINNQHGKI